eukprot:g12582.t1
MKRIAGVCFALSLFGSTHAAAAESELLVQFRQYLNSPAKWHTEEGLVLKHALKSTEPAIRKLAATRLQKLWKKDPEFLLRYKIHTEPISLVADAEIVHTWITSLEREQQKLLSLFKLTPKRAKAILQAGRGKDLPPAYRFAADRLPVLKRIRQTLLTDYFLASIAKQKSSDRKLMVLYQFDVSLHRMRSFPNELPSAPTGRMADLRSKQLYRNELDSVKQDFRLIIANRFPNLIPKHLLREFKLPKAAVSKILRSMLDDRNDLIRAAAHDVIAETGSDDDVLTAALIIASRSKESPPRALRDLIKRIRPEDRHAANQLKKLYIDPRVDVRCDVIAAVVQSRRTDRDVRRMLGKSLDSRNVFVRNHAVSALRELRLTKQCVRDDLIPALNSKTATILTSTTRRLAMLGRDARPAADALKTLLKHSDESVRCYAAVALYHAFDESKEYAPALIAALNSKRAAVRLDAIRSLTRFGPAPKSAIPELLKRLSDRDDRVTPTRFRNTAKSVGYVGNAACIECHPGEHKSYLETTHSRALADVDVSQEPPDAEFHHDISGRRYRVYRDGKTLRHREYILDSDKKEVVLADHPMKYSIGSGNFSRSYLLEIDGFLFESPLTWFSANKTWKMSPGYEDDRAHPGFSRPIDGQCMACHSGRVESVGDSHHRLNVTEMAISCERCHGPGELHVKERKAGLPVKDGFDDTIVNLAHLSRERQEDICAQCHLPSTASVAVRGRSIDDFRPGQRMVDFSVGFRLDTPDSEMTVVGHIEQMKLSRCYIDSKTMTCTTCHDPHSLPAENEKMSYYRKKCMNCHNDQSCKVPVKTRIKTQPEDSCIACHMPTRPTDIVHFAFTHHRVGIHKPATGEQKPFQNIPRDAVNRLVPIADISHLPPAERSRLRGLALEKFSREVPPGARHGHLPEKFREQSRLILEQLAAQGLRDPIAEAELSQMYWRRDPERCIMYARRALSSKSIPPKNRRYALYQLASSHLQAGRLDDAFPSIQELLRIERSEDSFMLAADYYRKRENYPETVRMVKRAIAITPHRPHMHDYLGVIYRRMKKLDLAAQHHARAELLRRVVSGRSSAKQSTGKVTPAPRE